MHYEKYYMLEWTWRYLDGKYSYSDSKTFATEEEINKFHLELMSNQYIEVLWCRKARYETWGSKG